MRCFVGLASMERQRILMDARLIRFVEDAESKRFNGADKVR